MEWKGNGMENNGMDRTGRNGKALEWKTNKILRMEEQKMHWNGEKQDVEDVQDGQGDQDVRCAIRDAFEPAGRVQAPRSEVNLLFAALRQPPLELTSRIKKMKTREFLFLLLFTIW